MRVGLSPVRYTTALKLPSTVTLATVTYIPVLSGYWEKSLDVLKVCISSLHAHTTPPFDLIVFDNGSAPPVIDYLLDLRKAGSLQHLILSSDNVGKMRALEFLVAAARSEYIAYTDSDVYFYPGWLEEEMRVVKAFPNAGMVSGVPTVQNFGHYTQSTLRFAEADSETNLERGRMIPDDWIQDYARSVGFTPEEFLRHHKNLEQVRLSRRGVNAYATATHMQFLAPLAVLKTILPLPLNPGQGDSVLDEALDDKGYLRLSVDGVFVHHLGNFLTGKWMVEANKVNSALKPTTPIIDPTSRVEAVAGLIARNSLLLRLLRRPVIYTYKQSFRLLSKLPPDAWN